MVNRENIATTRLLVRSLARVAGFLAALVCAPVLIMAAGQPIIVDALMGEPVPMEEMIDDLATVRIVYIGEFHTVARHHEAQADLLKGLVERKSSLALGMEMFAESQQPVLDKWRQGPGGVDSLINELGRERWTNLADYEPVLMLAKKMRIPIRGLNADDRIVKKIAREGMEGLSDAERQQIPADVDQINPFHERLLNIRLRVHKAFHEKALTNIILAQALRDATMAHAVDRFLKSPEGQDRIMVVIAGTGHVSYGFGIPERTEKLNGLTYRIVLLSESGELVLSEKEKELAAPITITHQDLKFIRVPIADYLHILPLKSSGEPADSLPVASSQ
ncbi:MAG: ChaN family lipoprotein [Deltaproteobacteria bacterium]|nr:ChaN family lipoprotein [Deltaproteobacteria bacterium]